LAFLLKIPFCRHSLAVVARRPEPDEQPAWDLTSWTMIRNPYENSIVLDRDYGARLRKLLESGPIWAIDAPANREVAQETWEEFPSRDHTDGITIFIGKGASPEEAFIAEFDMIDLHHGVYSAVPLTRLPVLSEFLSPTNSGRCSPPTASTPSLLRMKDLEPRGLCRRLRIGDARILVDSAEVAWWYMRRRLSVNFCSATHRAGQVTQNPVLRELGTSTGGHVSGKSFGHV
jgi:hypothetical protein